MAKTIAIIVIAVILVGFAAIGILYSVRGSPLKHVHAIGDGDGPPAIGDPQFRRTMELLTSMELLTGNRIEVMTNGNETYPRLWEDLRGAQRSITLQMYYFQPGSMADTLEEILIERARAGVRILFLFDDFGAQSIDDDYYESLNAAGVRTAKFRPVHWYSLHKAQSRSHIRVVVVDGSIGYTGGFGVDDKWFGDGRTKDQWRDTNVRFTGPAVMQLQATFAAGWVEATAELITGDVFFPHEGFHSDGDHLAALLHTAPTIGSTVAERFLALTIASARRTLYISNSYFVPDDDFSQLLIRAVRRGVDLRILTTSDETDVVWTWLAGRARYEELLRAGIRIYEYQPTMMHAKTMVADGVWSTIGTMNFDNRSMVFNDESNLVALDAGLGAALDSIFMKDLEFSTEIRLEEFQRRPWHQRARERFASLFTRLL
ncbi:MAG: phospholipase D-like domain-containing protein [Gemmatimonadota bacterium]|nr:phospholipase D-like domain-containing protein [Gemmatimonadota bacterium]